MVGKILIARVVSLNMLMVCIVPHSVMTTIFAREVILHLSSFNTIEHLSHSPNESETGVTLELNTMQLLYSLQRFTPDISPVTVLLPTWAGVTPSWSSPSPFCTSLISSKINFFKYWTALYVIEFLPHLIPTGHVLLKLWYLYTHLFFG